MKTCKGCGQPKVDREATPCYDVLNPEYDPLVEPMDPTVGPYCADCWPTTHTGALTT